MSKLPKEVEVIFEKNLDLYKILPNPLLINDSELINSITQQLGKRLGSTRSDDLYKITFKKDSSRELIIIQSEALAGLLGTTSIEKGKVNDINTLNELSTQTGDAILPSLLNLAIFSTIKGKFNKNICTITTSKNQQTPDNTAKLERIIEVITDSFGCIPLISIDSSLRNIHLARVIRSNDDCYELYASQKMDFLRYLEIWPKDFEVNYYREFRFGFGDLHIADFLETDLLNHSIFRIFENLVSGRVCEVLLSGNYSSLNIHRHRRLLNKVTEELYSFLDRIFSSLNREARRLESIMDDPDISVGKFKNFKLHLEQHNSGVNSFKDKLRTSLEDKLLQLDLLDQVTTKDEICLYLINGALLINGEPTALVENKSR